MVAPRRITLALVALVAACTPGVADADIGPQQVEALDRQGTTEIIVRREPGLNAAERADVRADADVTLARRSSLTDTEVVAADAGQLAEAVAELNRDPDVIYAEPVTVVSALSADPYFGSLWGLDNVGQNMVVPGGGGYYPGGTADADMDVPEAWAKATGAGVTVGIVDTGMLMTHPDLVNQVATNAGETGTDSLGRDKRSNGVDDDGNGYRDDWRGWDFVSGGSEGDSVAGPDNDPQDNHGHGTHVAGTIAAQGGNNEGISGVAPGARVMSLRALGANGSGSSIGVAEAFDYAGKLGLRIVNASLGAPALDQTQLTAIQAHPNTLYVIAAGNSNVDNDVTPHGPCALPAANILCVGASDGNDRRAGFSNYGATSVDVFAPGTAILSTYISPAYEYLQGTSMASPNVAGVAALVLSAGPGASALDVKSAIMASTEAKPDLAGKSVTGGRVNAEKAVAGAVGGAPANVLLPSIAGTPRQGVALGATSGTWSPTGASYGYVWQRSSDGGSTWTAIVGGNASMYTPGASDIGAKLRVTVTATNPYGVASATSASVGPVVSGAPASTVAPAISGTLRRGQVLSVGGVWSPSGTSYAYQWQRSTDGSTWTAIGTNAATYTLTTAEREARVRVIVTASNAFGQTAVATDPTAPVVFDPPTSTTPPVITGTTQRSFTLTAATGSWGGTGNAYTYRWQRDDGSGWTAINGATASTYKLARDDEGARVRTVVTASNVDGTVEQASAASGAPISPFPPANTVAPVITGTPQRSRTLSASRGTWTGPDNSYGFQWQRDFGEGYVDIAGATGSAYTLTVADVDATVRVLVTATNPDAAIVETSEPTAPVLAAGPLNQGLPVVSGSAQRGLTLTGTAGSWSGIGNVISYQWQSSSDGSAWARITGATSPTYALATSDVGTYVRLLVTVTNPDATASASSAATVRVASSPPVNSVRPTLSGQVQRGSMLTANIGTWTGNGNGYAYQWQRDGVDIAGATNPVYTLSADDVNATVRAVIIASNPDGSASAASSATATIPSAAPVNSVRPTVSGSTQRASTLTGTAGTWSGIGNSTSYQWQSSPDGVTWTAIGGATSLTYAIVAGDVGSSLRLLVTVSNADGTASAVSTATAKAISAPPVNSARPTIGGTVQRASTLLGTYGSWSGIGNGYSYQWQRSLDGTNWLNIAGATATGYELTVADVGATIRLLVSASNPDATVTAASNPTATVPSAPPVNAVRPALTGSAARGSTLSATAGSWSGIGNTSSYQWQRSLDQGASWQDIDGATSATYTLVGADVGTSVRVSVTTTNPERSATQASTATATVTGAGPVNTVAPAISGSAQRTVALTSTPGTWSGNGNAFGYQWQRSSDGTNWSDIAGATGAGYELVSADVGAKVRLLVTATNPDGAASRASAASATVKAAPPVNTGLPIVTGATLRATTLSASQGSWSGPGLSFAYQWQHDVGSGFTDIAGATGPAYLLGVADVGTTLRVRVTATNSDASVSATSLVSSVVRAGPPFSTGAPAIAGTPRRLATLTSTPGSWGGIENDYAYQWQRRTQGASQFTNIAGATGATYTLESSDVAAQIRLQVIATNLDGTASATSAATQTVAGAPPRSGGVPTISGEARRGATLTAAAGDWTPDGLAYAYSWQRDGVDIAGATSSAYALQAADVGRFIRVKVTATNVDGSASATSAATERVAAPPVNTVAPAAPSGTPKEASTLTAVAGTWDTPAATLTFTWVRCAAEATAVTTGCLEIGAGGTYTLQAADVGSRIGVRVVATSSGGVTMADSALSAAVVRPPLLNVAPPGIAGTAYVGETLNGDAGRWTFPAAEVTYDWRRCDADGTSNCVSVGGGAHYTLGADDVDHAVVLFVTATTPGQSAAAHSTPLAVQARPVPRSLDAPAVTGAAIRARTLHAGTGTWTNSPGRFGYQWLRCAGANCHEIAGATADAYLLTAADKGFSISVAVTAANAWGSDSARSAPTAAVAGAPPVNTSVPVIASPNPLIQQGMTLTVAGFAWTATADTTYSLSWERCTAGMCRTISGATGAQYTLLAADVGSTIVAVSTAENVDATVSARSAETAVATVMAGPRWKTLPLISNSPGRVGDTVTATPGTWSGPVVITDVTEMMRCTNVCVPRGVANDPTYKIADSDLGAILRVRETATNVGGVVSVWSARYVGPVINTQAAAGVLSSGETALRNAQGTTLALATLSGAGVARASAAKPKTGAKVSLRRPAKVKGSLVAWACPAAVNAGETPPPCSAQVKLRKSATLRLPASATGKVRVVVIRARR